MGKIFGPAQIYKVKELSEVTITPQLLDKVFTQTPIQSEKKNPDNTPIQITLIPRATNSLKVLAELPIIVVLMYQLYKNNVHHEVSDFIPLILVTITLQPSQEQMKAPTFNREVFVDFMSAQIKTLSFLAYIVRLYQDQVTAQAGRLTQGMLSLLKYCPPEVAHLKKELLIAARHILATELRNNFVSCIDQLFDDAILIGTGWTAYESLRPLAYSTVADLVHHIRSYLSLDQLTIAVSVFSRNVHDETLPLSIQTMSCKLLMNLVECLKNKIDEGPQARELLVRMLEVMVLKFQCVAELHIPALIAKSSGSGNVGQVQQTHSFSHLPIPFPQPTTPQQHHHHSQHPGTPSTPNQGQNVQQDSTPGGGVGESSPARDEKPKFGFPPHPSSTYNLTDCRSLVKTLVAGVKAVVNGIPSAKVGQVTSTESSFTKIFYPKETIIFIRLVKHALKALDVYMLTPGGPTGATGGPHISGGGVGGGIPGRPPPIQAVRSKEEKEVLEHFAGIFHVLSPQVFREIFSTMIDYVVERIHENYALQIVANSFLAHPSTSPIFATILVEYLLERIEDIGTNEKTSAEKSNLYLKLFKLVFGSVSLFALDNEQMLKPHLHAIVNRSMELALTAKEPYNYFLLLRALFRSIGGGCHDLLYQEFLPLLPSLLQGLNSLQSGLHKQHMRDLFVELCLTVPVRLSSLLPYLPMLMDPLVSALNGSQTLVSQGLRTLELCVDNLQPDFLYDHIQPVRAELMQALWRSLRKPNEPIAQGAFRVLGKFGGGNRKMMTEPQKIRFQEVTSGSSVVVSFLDHKDNITLSVDKAIEVAFNSLKSSTTDPFYRRQCWEVIRGFLVANLQIQASDEEDKHTLKRFLSHSSWMTNDIPPLNGPFYKCHDSEVRRIHELALTGMFVAAAIKELRGHVLPFMVQLVRHYTLVAVSQQSGPINLGGRQSKLHSMDPLVLVDAVASVMGHEEKELCKPGHVALIVILDTASTVLGSKERACQLPLTEYLVERMSSLCYERAWYAKLGGCIAIKFLFERMTLKWVLQHQFVFVRALLFVLMDLTGEVSSGAIDMAKINLEKLLTLCATPITPSTPPSDTNGQSNGPDNSALIEAQNKSLNEVTQELIRQLTSSNTLVRQEVVHSLEVLARVQNKTVTEVIEPHKEVLQDMIPPKKHNLKHQPVNAQIGIMDGNTFCFNLEPRIFTIDASIPEHEAFFEELFKLCDAEDAILSKIPCYKHVTNLVPLRKSALRCMASIHHSQEGVDSLDKVKKDKIFSVLFKALSSSNTEIQETGFDCMKTFIQNVQIEPEVVSNAVLPLFRCIIGNHLTLNLNVLSRLTYLAQLFPSVFHEPIVITPANPSSTDKPTTSSTHLSEKMLNHLKKWLEATILATRQGRRATDEMKICASIINLFTKIHPLERKFCEISLSLVFKTEKAMFIEPGSIMRIPLRKLLQRFPEHTLEMLMLERNINEDQIYRFIKFLLKGEEGKVFRDVLLKNPDRLVKYASGVVTIEEKVSVNQQLQAQLQQRQLAAQQQLIQMAQQQQQQGQQQPQMISQQVVQQQQVQQHVQIPQQIQVQPPQQMGDGSTGSSQVVLQQGQVTPQIQIQQQPQQVPQQPATLPTPPATQTVSVNYDLQYQAILITSILVKYDPTWLSTQPKLVSALKNIWLSDSFHSKHSKVETIDYVQWEEPKLLVKCLINYFDNNREDIEILFRLLKTFTVRYICDFEFFRQYLDDKVSRFPVDWKRNAFMTFVSAYHNESYTQSLKAKILQFIVIPAFAISFEAGEGEQLIGGPPSPEQNLPDNLISVFINDVIDPDWSNKPPPSQMSDGVRILLLQFSCLLVEQASPHIHDVQNKKQGNKLRRLMTFAWPCLLVKNCVDPATKYHGHLLLAHIISKFAIHKRIVLQVFHSLLKAFAVEARGVVRQALEILTPAMPQRMEDGNTMLTHWTKKIIIEEGHTLGQLVHMLQLLVRHFRVYYPVRHHLIQHMVTSVQRLGFTPNASIEHKKIAVDLAEVIIRWEVQRIKESQTGTGGDQDMIVDIPQTEGPSTPASSTSGTIVKTEKPSDIGKPIDKQHADSIVNFLLRMACHVNEGGQNVGTPGEMLSRRCVQFLKVALKPEQNVWPNAELRLAWFEKLLLSADPQVAQQLQQPPNYGNICTALELLGFLLTILRREIIISSFKPLQKGIASCMICPNTKVIRCVHNLLTRMYAMFPPTDIPASVQVPGGQPTECPFELLYSSVQRVILDGLSNYEKAPQANPQLLFSTLMILKAACVNNVMYIDRMIPVFMRVLLRMARDHINPQTSDLSPIQMSSELLILSLDLVKNRVGVMGNEMRKVFFQQILAQLIEKSTDVKVLKAITKMVEDWIKFKAPQGSIGGGQGPVLKEKGHLLIKMMQHYEKRFPQETELHAQFLELVNYIYRDENLKNTDLIFKLEMAFLSGLRSPQPAIRAKFFEVFDASVRKRIFDRLLYIICSQNWEHIGQHFWIKQCIELLLVTAVPNTPLESANPSAMLPSPTAVILLGDQSEKSSFYAQIDVDGSSVSSFDPSGQEEDMDIEISSTEGDGQSKTERSTFEGLQSLQSLLSGMTRRPSTPSDPKVALSQLIKKETAFLNSLKETQTLSFLVALSQLCHMDLPDEAGGYGEHSSLPYQIWVQLFPKLWNVLNEKQQQLLSAEIVPFICSGIHINQKEQPASAIGCFVEAVSKCNPPINIRPSVLKYIGKTHNLWHRAALMLEQTVLEKTCIGTGQKSSIGTRSSFLDDGPSTSSGHSSHKIDVTVQIQNPSLEALDSLNELYESLREEDLWTGFWSRRAKYPETVTAISLENQGLFEQAQTAYESVMLKSRNDFSSAPSPVSLKSELLLWEKHWIKCSKELNQWDSLLEYGSTKGCLNPQLVMDAAWRIPNSWTVMRDAVYQVENNCPRDIMWKVALYKGYCYLMDGSGGGIRDENHIALSDRMSDAAATFSIKEWRKLPPVVSHSHIHLLQAAQLIQELNEAGQIQHGFLPSQTGRTNSLHDMKAIVKTWRNRLPVLSDDLCHWSDIFSWRNIHYQSIVNHYESQGSGTPSLLPTVAGPPAPPPPVVVSTPPVGPSSVGGGAAPSVSINPSLSGPQTTPIENTSVMLGVHATAQSIIYFGKIARKQGLLNVCLNRLDEIHKIPSVPVVDCFQKIRQQVKCYLLMAGGSSTPKDDSLNCLQKAHELLEATNVKFFAKEMNAEFYALKGHIHALLGRSDDANKAFSASAQLHDALNKAWSLWGDYLESSFTRDIQGPKWESRQMHLAVSALTCYLQACRHQNEAKSRKYIAKILWLLTYDKKEKEGQGGDTSDKDKGDYILEKTIKSYSAGIPPINWLPWIPQLFTWLVRSDGKLILEILTQVGRLYPQAVYFPLRTLYLTLKSERFQQQRMAGEQPSSQQSSQGTEGGSSSQGSSQSASQQPQTEKMTAVSPAMWRCSRIMHTQRDLHPTVLTSLEALVDQFAWFKDSPYEEVLRQLRQALAKCYAVAFEHRGNVADAPVTPNTLNFVNKMVSTFGIGIENPSFYGSHPSSSFSTAASESLAQRVQATTSDPVFQAMKDKFTTDFDFSTANLMKLHNLIKLIKKWIKILEAKTRILPKSMLIEEKCRFLSNFCQQTAEVELPGEFLIPRHSHYYVRIARFMPKVEVVTKHNTSARRISIRGHNGKIYPYLLINDASLSDARREERVLQLLRLVNHFLTKQKETARRFLAFTVPRVVAFAPQTRLVEDNPTSLSLLDVFKERCARNNSDSDAPIARYYDKLQSFQSRATSAFNHQTLRDIMNNIQKDIVPPSVLKEWASQTFPSATDYWTFRKQLTIQIALINFAEYVLHLTRLNPDMLYIHQDSGLVNVSYFRFDIDDSSGELLSSRPVPFRLTHNLSELMTPIGVAGPLTSTIIATARSLSQPQFKVQAILKTILRDEVIGWYKEHTDEREQQSQGGNTIMPGDKIVLMVNKYVNAIMGRMQSLAAMEGDSSNKVQQLVAAANSTDNLCRMDPAWHPWL